MSKNLEFVDKLRASGLRPTKQRLKICKVLFNRENTFHFTINDLAKNISGKKINSVEVLIKVATDNQNQK